MVLIRKRLFFVLSIFLALPFVSAAIDTSFISEGIKNGIEVFKSIFTPLIEAVLGTSYFEEYFFEKSILLFFLFVVYRAVFNQVPAFRDNRAVGTVVAAVISIISVRYMSANQMVMGVFLPASALGIVTPIILFFAAAFYLCYFLNLQAAGRKLVWILFAISLAVVAYKSELGDTMSAIYMCAIVVAGLLLIFDTSIHRYFYLHQAVNRFAGNARLKAVAALQAEYLSLVNVNTNEANRRKRDIIHELNTLGASLNN